MCECVNHHLLQVWGKVVFCKRQSFCSQGGFPTCITGHMTRRCASGGSASSGSSSRQSASGRSACRWRGICMQMGVCIQMGGLHPGDSASQTGVCIQEGGVCIQGGCLQGDLCLRGSGRPPKIWHAMEYVTHLLERILVFVLLSQ